MDTFMEYTNGKEVGEDADITTIANEAAATALMNEDLESEPNESDHGGTVHHRQDTDTSHGKQQQAASLLPSTGNNTISVELSGLGDRNREGLSYQAVQRPMSAVPLVSLEHPLVSTTDAPPTEAALGLHVLQQPNIEQNKNLVAQKIKAQAMSSLFLQSTASIHKPAVFHENNVTLASTIVPSKTIKADGTVQKVVDLTHSHTSDSAAAGKPQYQVVPNEFTPTPQSFYPMDVDTVDAANSAAKPAIATGVSVLSPAQRQSLSNIVMGNSKKALKSVQQAVSPSTTPRNMYEIEREDLTEDKTDDARKPARKLLVAKKERELARTLLRNKRDLNDLLSREDCVFLATNFWVFTVEQLRFVLRSERMMASLDLGDEDKKERVQNAFQCRQAIERKLAQVRRLKIDEPSTRPSVGAMGTVKRLEDGSTNDGASPVTALANEIKADSSIKKEESSEALPNTYLIAGLSRQSNHDMELISTAKIAGASEESKLDQQTLVASKAAETNAISGQTAQSQIESWEALVSKAEDIPWTDLEERFPLSGAISCLFPKNLQNFFASIPITYLYGFFCLKRTETGAICDFFQAWRAECGLSKLPSLSLAKYILGTSFRIEQAMSSVPPVTARSKKWMGGSLVALTGAAREFLVEDRNIFTAQEFVETRTKDLSLALEKWREVKGLPVLKGSGKVAMISGWKAAAREAIEIESQEGKIVDHNFSETAFSNDIPVFVKESRLPDAIKKAGAVELPKVDATRKRKGLEDLSRPAQYAAHSELFVEDVLGGAVTKILSEAGIRTAADAFEASALPDSAVAVAMQKADRVERVEECQTVLREWCRSLRDHLIELGNDEREKNVPAPKSAKQTFEIIQELSETPVKQHSRRKTTHALQDPLEGLSTVSVIFLSTIGIGTAEQFLTTRTTDVANEFVKYREDNGMPELKGLGAVASVSGWKSTCRRMAKEMGMEDIAALEPVDKSSWDTEHQTSSNRTKSASNVVARKPQPTKADVVVSPQNSTVVHEDALHGKPRKIFAVQGSEEQHRFEISVRKSCNTPNLALYITYKGRGAPFVDPEIINDNFSHNWGKVCDDVLREVPLSRGDKIGTIDLRAPFASSRPGCGLFELSTHDVRPIHCQHLELLKNNLKRFVLTPPECDVVPLVNINDVSAFTNVCLQKSPLGNFYFMMFFDKPIQRGQTTQIYFPVSGSRLAIRKDQEVPYRMKLALDEELSLLSRSDLKLIIDFLLEMQNSVDTGFAQGSSGSERNHVPMLVAKQRLSWTFYRILAALKDEGKLLNEQSILRFKRSFVFSSVDSEERSKKDLAHCLHNEIMQCALAVIHGDVVCGVERRVEWCPLQREFFEKLLEKLGCLYDPITTVSVDVYMNYIVSLLTKFVGKSLQVEECVFGCRWPEGLNDGSTEGWVACKVNDAFDSENAVTSVYGRFTPRRSQEVLDGKAELCVSFYHQAMGSIASCLIFAFGHSVDPEDFPTKKILNSLRDLFANSVEGKVLRESTAKFECNAEISATTCLPNFEPHSYPFFLGIVWPVLKKLEWRFDVGTDRSAISFVPPTHKSKHKRKRKLKEQRSQRRRQLSRSVDKLGLGVLPKSTKRLINSACKDFDESEESSVVASIVGDTPDAEGESAETAFDQFLRHKQNDIPDERHKRGMEVIVAGLRECFDCFAPSLCLTQEDECIQPKEVPSVDKRPGDVYGNDVLMRFLLILPTILRRSGLSAQQLESSLDVLREVTSFMSSNYKALFDEAFQPPQESYVHDDTIEAARTHIQLTETIDNEVGISAIGEDRVDEPIVIVRDKDKATLTDFTVKVMEQVVACCATEDDIKKKSRRIEYGFPGIACKHCMGAHGEGRYFFSSIDSLMTASSAVEKHLARCHNVSSELKADVTKLKEQHLEQRKTLAPGGQAAFFNHLWNRLRASPIADVSQLLMRAENTLDSDDDVNSLTNPIEWKDHVLLLDHIRTTEPWKNNTDLKEALNQYYNCLDYGGRIFNTMSMPKHFSSEWLLAKVVPKRASYAKPNMPG